MNRAEILKEFPYSTKISASYQVVTPKEHDKHLALASIDSLKELLDIPKEQIEANPDLLYISADLWVGGMANKNRDAITKEDTIELAKNIPHKYLNLEHEEEQIVGCLLTYGFREYTNERNFVAAENADKYEKPLVASGGGFVWKSVYPKLSDFLIKASDKNSENYGDASFSWEVFFKDFVIMEGSRFIDEATIIDDPAEIEKRVPHLKQKGGSGKYEGKEIYRLVKGPKIFLGAGIVKNPAADVKGILTAETEEEVEKIKEANASVIKFGKAVEKVAASRKPKKSIKIKNNSTKFSQNKKTNVINYTAMKIKDLEQYNRVLASVGETPEVDHKTLAALQAFDIESEVEKLSASRIGDEIRKESAKFAAEKKELEEAKSKAAEEKEKIEAELTELKEKSQATDTELAEMKEKLQAEEQSRVFSERMEALNEEYELGEDDSKVIAKQIKGLDEESYASWIEDFKIFAKEKNKKYKAEKMAEMKKKEEKEKEAEKSKASTQETDEEKEAREKEESEKAIAAAQAKAKEDLANSQHEAVTNLSDKFKDLELELAD